MTAMDALLIVVSHLFGVGASDDDREERVLFHGSMLQVVFQFLACFVNIFQRLTTFTSFFLVLYVALRFRKIDTKLKFLLVYGICAVTAVFFCSNYGLPAAMARCRSFFLFLAACLDS